MNQSINTSEVKRFALYWHNGGGVGHLVRQSRIAAAILELDQAACIFGISGSSRVLDQILPDGMDLVKLPSFVYQQKPYRKSITNASMDLVRQMRRELLSAFMSSYEPDVLLVDHQPGGWSNELSHTYASSKTHKILGLRGVMENRTTTNNQYFDSKTIKFIVENFERIFVYTDPNIFRLEAYYDIPDALVSRFIYTGYVAPQLPTPESHSTLARTGKVLVAHFGGGQGAEHFWRILIKVLLSMQGCFYRCYLFAGAYATSSFLSEIQSQVSNATNIVWQPFSRKMVEWIAHADIFVGAGGYNTIAEVLCTHSNALLVNRHEGSDEQDIHITQLAGVGLVHACHQSQFNENDLPLAIEYALANPRPLSLAPKPQISGAHLAAKFLISGPEML